MAVGFAIPHGRSLDDANPASESDGSSFGKSRARRHFHPRRGSHRKLERADGFIAAEIFTGSKRQGNGEFELAAEKIKMVLEGL